ncbi:hypothetical protein [Rhizobium sp. RAF56]|uniref:hypothetical protein n=1 Tax=Rhizobium sp. RAF56 TaxID=3233062 RepID=UPI003F9497E9
MTATSLIESEFSPRERAELWAANTRLGGLYSARPLDDWLAFVPQVRLIHRAAQNAVGADSSKERYDDFLRGYLKELMPNFNDGDDAREEFNHLVWFGEDADRLSILARYRARLCPSQHVNLATPRAARKAVQQVLDAYEAEDRARKRAAKEAAREAVRKAEDKAQKRTAKYASRSGKPKAL